MSNQLAFALDTADKEQAAKLLDAIDPYIGAVKVGLEYFIANGSLPETTKPIILDLKLHDIPETVARAVWQVCERDARIKYITLHVQQREALTRAVDIAQQYGVTLLGVTVLTSMTADDLADVNGPSRTFVGTNVMERVDDRIRFAHGCGIRGFVCSPHEVKIFSPAYPDHFFLVPGIRPIGSDAGDQKRIGTPEQAIKDGASMLVVGRPIRDAKNPSEAAKLISEEITRTNDEMRRERDKL